MVTPKKRELIAKIVPGQEHPETERLKRIRPDLAERGLVDLGILMTEAEERAKR